MYVKCTIFVTYYYNCGHLPLWDTASTVLYMYIETSCTYTCSCVDTVPAISGNFSFYFSVM